MPSERSAFIEAGAPVPPPNTTARKLLGIVVTGALALSDSSEIADVTEGSILNDGFNGCSLFCFYLFSRSRWAMLAR